MERRLVDHLSRNHSFSIVGRGDLHPLEPVFPQCVKIPFDDDLIPGGFARSWSAAHGAVILSGIEIRFDTHSITSPRKRFVKKLA